MTRPAIAIALLLCACGGDDTRWLTARRVEASATASGVAFGLQVPDGFVKGGDAKYPGWRDKADMVSFQVSALDHPIDSVEAAVDQVTIPGDQSVELGKRAALPDGGYLVTTTTPPDHGVLFVDVFRPAGRGALQCHGSARASGTSFSNMPEVLAALEEICASMRAR